MSKNYSKSGGNSANLSSLKSPYANATTTLVDKSTIIWKDFLYGVSKRKGMIDRLKLAAAQPTSPPPLLKRLLMEIRQTTLVLIEDALEIEYRAQIYDKKLEYESTKTMKLTPITSFKSMEDKENVLALAEVVTDIDELFRIPNIRVLLPIEFPETRNPFMLGKSVDDLAYMVTPQSAAGNREDELKVLELLRYRRAAKALVRAEAQVLNRLPIELTEVEALMERMKEDLNLERLIRGVCTLLDNDQPSYGREANMKCIRNPIFSIEAHELLSRLNQFTGAQPMRVDVQAAVRQLLQDCHFDDLEDNVSKYLVEWINLVSSKSYSRSSRLGQSPVKGNIAPPTSSQQRKSSYRSVGDLALHHSRSTEGLPSPARKRSKVNEYAEIASEVDMHDYKGTHENIYTEKRPMLKMKPLSPDSMFNRARPKTSQKGVSALTERNLKSREATPQTQTLTPLDRMKSDFTATVPMTEDRPTSAPAEHLDTSTQVVSAAAPQALAPMARTTSQLSAVSFANGYGSENGQPKMSMTAPAGSGSKPVQQASGRRIRFEVQKIIKELGLMNEDKKDKKKEYDTGDRLSSVRYELHRMQQELLRKQVLDPRHYRMESIDSQAQKQKGLSSELNLLEEGGNITMRANRQSTQTLNISSEATNLITLAENIFQPEPPISEDAPPINPAILEVVMDTSASLLIGKVDANVTTYNTRRNRAIITRQNVCFFTVSRLIFNRITDHLFEELSEAKSDTIARLLQRIFAQLQALAQKQPRPLGRVIASADRLLHRSEFAADGVQVDLQILRRDECDGLLIHCTPLAGIFNVGSQRNAAGPVTLTVFDRELQVLLINQHGLFMLALSRWSSMEMVAKWLLTRIIIRKVRTVDHSGLDDASEHLKPVEPKDADDNGSEVSKISGGLEGMKELTGGDGSPQKEGSQEDENSLGSDFTPWTNLDSLEKKPAPKPVANNPVSKNNFPRSLIMLDVQLNRRIELSKDLRTQWKSRNVPKITGIQVDLTAVQDLEMLVFNVKVTIPHPKTFFRMQKESERRKRGNVLKDGLGSASVSSQETMTGGNVEKVEEEEEEDFDPIEINLSYRLTSSEISIFGASDFSELKKVALSRRQVGMDDHPETFVWNILNRLRVFFKGSEKTPYQDIGAQDPANWEMHYVRKLTREVKTVSKEVLVLEASAVGGELIFEPESVDKQSTIKLKGKKFSESELNELVHSEGWPIRLQDHHQRMTLAVKMMDKLKLVEENEVKRLEIYSFPETKLLTVFLNTSPEEPELELGSVEINYHCTLVDVRVLIKHELDTEDLPPQFRFMYKGTMCAVKQEPFRRAWDCLPQLVIVPKKVDKHEIAIETENLAEKRFRAGGTRPVDAGPRFGPGQRRLTGRYVPVPLPTLCEVREDRAEIFLLHDSPGMLAPGDVIRIGNVESRDYIIAPMREQDIADNPKTLKLQPSYNLLEEAEFSFPTRGNFSFPAQGTGIYVAPYTGKIENLLKTPAQMGIHYEFPETDLDAPINVPSPGGVEGAAASGTLDEDNMSLTSQLSEASLDSAVENQSTVSSSEIDLNSKVSKQKKKKLKKRRLNQTYQDCWLWKCVIMKDTRPKWRQMYDDGEVQYYYEYANSSEFVEYFRVKATYRYLEVLCTDSRIPELAAGHQRVNEIVKISIDFYLKLIFDKMTDWPPLNKRGLDKTKIMKLLNEVTAFPDLKRSPRIIQLETLINKIIKSEHGVPLNPGRGVSYSGFVLLLQEMAMMRFPPKPKGKEDSASTVPISTTAFEDAISAATSAFNSISNLNTQSAAGLGTMTSIAEDAISIDDSIELDSVKSLSSGARSPKRRLSNVSSSSPFTRRSFARRRSITGKKKDDSLLTGVDPAVVAYSLQRLVVDHLMTFSGWYDVVWREAKLMAIHKEALPYCAASRLAALHRGRAQRKRFYHFLYHFSKFQANVRRKLSSIKTEAYIRLLQADWCYRVRYHAATLLQSLLRRYLKRCWFHRVMVKVKAQQVQVQRARRFKLKKMRQAAKKAVVFKEIKRVNGIMVFVKINRVDSRSFTRDCGIIVHAYVPLTQGSWKFHLEDLDFRNYMAIELGVEVVSMGELMDKRNLKKLIASRLIVNKPNSRHANLHVSFSKHALGQRGVKTVTRAKRVGNEFFVCRVFETGDEISVQLYHRLTCNIYNCSMPLPEMHAWITEEYQIQCTDDMAKHLVPPELRPDNKKLFFNWVLDHLAIDKRKGVFRVLFSIQLMKSRKSAMIILIQSIIRRALIRPRIANLLDSFMLKVKTSAFEEDCYYLNRLTGATSWEKPRLLGSLDLPTPITRRWVSLQYEQDGEMYTHYVNPYTGCYTHLVPDQAARLIQAMVRNFLLKAISMPFEHFVKAGTIAKNAQRQYETNKRLASIINLAIVKHVVELDEDRAKDLYAESVDLSEANPLVTRAYAFFMVGTCEPPMAVNRDRASILLGDAESKDPTQDKFSIAYRLFQFACLKSPDDYRTLLNLALVQCMLYKNNHNAEKLLRRALAIAPFESRVVEIWKYLKDRFPEKQLLYNPHSRVHKIKTSKPGQQKRVIHGREVAEDPQWAGWCYVEKDTYQVSKQYPDLPYWYNPADGTEQLDPPEFTEQWEIRKRRSHYEQEENGFELYFDPLTSEYFEYHSLTETYA